MGTAMHQGRQAALALAAGVVTVSVFWDVMAATGVSALLASYGNPKSILAWIALVTLGLGPDASATDVILILAGCAVLSVTIFCGYAVVFSTQPMVRMYRRARRGIEGVLAVSFGYAGLRLLLSRN
nr:LysE family transporter [Mesorhizobium sp. AR07]